MQFVIVHRGPKGERIETEVTAEDRAAVFKLAESRGIKSVIEVRPGKATSPSKPMSPSLIRGLLAGVIVVALAAVVWLFLPKQKTATTVDEHNGSALIKEVAPSITVRQEAETEKDEGKSSTANDTAGDPDTNVVWISKTKYVKRMENGCQVTVYVGDPDEYKAKPIFTAHFNNFLTNFLEPGATVPPTPIEFTEQDIKDAILEKIEITDEDDDEVRFAKENIAVLQKELAKELENGVTAREFIAEIQRRQDMEAALVNESREMIINALGEDSPEHAKELYDALNKHLNEKGIPSMRLPKKFRKMIEGVE